MADYTEIFRNNMFHWIRTAYKIARLVGRDGIKAWQDEMKKGLQKGYDTAGAKRGSGPTGFLKYVVERDRALDLSAGGEVIDQDTFIYWIEDFFSPLKEEGVTEQEYEDISTRGYLAAKIEYFCPGFEPKLVKSPWRGDKRTEWILRRK